MALCDSIDMADADKVSYSLMRFFAYYNQAQEFLKLSIFKEVKFTGTYLKMSCSDV